MSEQLLYTPEQVGEMIAMPVTWVMRQYREGKIRGLKLGYRSVRFRVQDIEAYISGLSPADPAEDDSAA